MKIRTLIIEDEEPHLKKAIAVLQAYKEGVTFDCQTFTTAYAAEEYTKKNWNTIDLVFLDMSLETDEAGIRYLRMMEKFSSENKKIIPFKVIIISAHLHLGSKVLQELKSDIKMAVIGFVSKFDDYEIKIEECLNRYIAEAFGKEDLPKIELTFERLYQGILVNKKMDGMGEVTFCLLPEHILYVVGAGSYQHWYLTQEACKLLDTKHHPKRPSLLEIESKTQVDKLNEEIEEIEEKIKNNDIIAREKSDDKFAYRNIVDDIKSKERTLAALKQQAVQTTDTYKTRYIEVTKKSYNFEKIINKLKLEQFRLVKSKNNYYINLRYLLAFQASDNTYYLADNTGDNTQIHYLPR